MTSKALKPTRFYLRTSSNAYRRLIWFHNHKKNEMLLGISGLDGRPGRLRYIFPEYTLSTPELSAVTYRHADATRVDTEIDHITCHADGRFHMKTRDDKPIYSQRMQRAEALGPNTSRFLEFIVCSDVAARYGVIQGKPKHPCAWVVVAEDEAVSLRASFAGAKYPLEVDVARTIGHLSGGKFVAQPAILLECGTLKGVLWGSPQKLPPKTLNARFRGTLISFKFPVAKDKWRIKTFVFE